MATLSLEVPDIEIREYLAADPRPTVLVDLQSPQRICFKNPTFTSEYDFEIADLTDDAPERQAFRNWVFSHPSKQPGESINCCGSTWVATTLRERWRIIQSATVIARISQVDGTVDESRGSTVPFDRSLTSRSVEEHDVKIQSFQEGARNHDWTAPIPQHELSPHIQLLRSWDWSKTPLGAIETWPPLLISMANILMVDPRPV
jgi:hypothetical protein